MTIITKPSNDKKSDKLALPLFTDGQPSAPPASVNEDADNHSHSSLHVITQRRRTSSATTIFLFLSAIAVMCMGILGGVAIYRLYVPSQLERVRFHGFCGVPYDSQSISDEDMLKVNNNYRASSLIKNLFGPDSQVNVLRDNNQWNSDFFSEEFELDLSDEESYSKINVPEFKDGRRGRFIHDFKQNESGIIDSDASRCFIMPLDRETVLPPKNLYDLLLKMWDGYYNIDTDRVRKDMRVVTPELTDMSLISPKIAAECKGMKVYLLEKYISGVFKRDVHITDAGKFAEFSGKHIVEFDLININEIDNLEKMESKK